MRDFVSFTEFGILAFFVFLAMLFGFFAFAASRPAGNPLRAIAGMLATRLGVTLGIGMVDVPLAFMGPAGDLFDAGSIVAVSIYWLSFFFQAARAFRPPIDTLPARPTTPTVAPLTLPYPRPTTIEIEGKVYSAGDD